MDIAGAMSRQEIDAFLGQAALARIATAGDGRPHVVPMWFDWDGERFWMETGVEFRKHRNLLANPNRAVSVNVTEGGLRFEG